MIKFRPSIASDNSPLPPLLPENPDRDTKRIPLVWIPATLGLGLLIAAVYLGGRIITGHAPAKAPAAQVAGPIPAQPVVKPELSEVKEAAAPRQKFPGHEPLTVVTPEDGIPMIAPQAGQLFIQVGALDQQATRRFVQHLRNQNLEPHVAPGPTPELMRVLIGPFDDRDALNEKKAQLEAERIDTFVRRY